MFILKKKTTAKSQCSLALLALPAAYTSYISVSGQSVWSPEKKSCTCPEWGIATYTTVGNVFSFQHGSIQCLRGQHAPALSGRGVNFVLLCIHRIMGFSVLTS
uniref:Secreted protein n=1 Tax=Pyxicephalus adspersus TaxID=30357 RepID=A0AAV3AWH0_PYXAD|nr:TPA: hypothetical protein GDO54_006808 [Pyxicephalus adspersus]